MNDAEQPTDNNGQLEEPVVAGRGQNRIAIAMAAAAVGAAGSWLLLGAMTVANSTHDEALTEVRGGPR